MKIVGIGEILWDVFGDKKTLGGAPANFAFHAAQLGANATMISAIGNDFLGDLTRDELAKKRVPAHLQRVPAPTGTVEISLDKNGVATYAFPPNVAWDFLEFDDFCAELAPTVDAICFGSLAQRSPRSRETILRFLKSVPATALKIFDANLRQDFYSPEILRESLELANVLKINEDELAIFGEIFLRNFSKTLENARDFSTKIFASFPQLRLIVLTLGARGSEIFSFDGSRSRVPANPATRVIDTVGAGDSFTAALVVNLLAGTPLPLAHRRAAALADFVCSRPGAMPEHTIFGVPAKN